MSLWFDLIQSAEIHDQQKAHQSLEQRVENLEKWVVYLNDQLEKSRSEIAQNKEQ